MLASPLEKCRLPLVHLPPSWEGAFGGGGFPSWFGWLAVTGWVWCDVAWDEVSRTSGSHLATALCLRRFSIWSARWSLKATPSEIDTGGGEGVPSCEGGVAAGVIVAWVGCGWTATSPSRLQYLLSVTLAGGRGGHLCWLPASPRWCGCWRWLTWLPYCTPLSAMLGRPGKTCF